MTKTTVERQHLLIQRAYNDGLDSLGPSEWVEVLKAPGFDYFHYCGTSGALKEKSRREEVARQAVWREKE